MGPRPVLLAGERLERHGQIEIRKACLVVDAEIEEAGEPRPAKFARDALGPSAPTILDDLPHAAFSLGGLGRHSSRRQFADGASSKSHGSPSHLRQTAATVINSTQIEFMAVPL